MKDGNGKEITSDQLTNKMKRSVVENLSAQYRLCQAVRDREQTHEPSLTVAEAFYGASPQYVCQVEDGGIRYCGTLFKYLALRLFLIFLLL